jgi:putative membrane protein
MMYYHYYSPFHFVFSFICWLIFFIVVLLVIKSVKGRNNFIDKIGKHGFGHDSAMELLRERYVKGEISKEEFETKKKDLMS